MAKSRSKSGNKRAKGSWDCPKRKDGKPAHRFVDKESGKKYILRRSKSGKARRVYCSKSK